MKIHEHPLAIAVGAVVGTMTVFFTVVQPIWDKELNNNIADLNNTITQIRQQDGVLKDTDISKDKQIVALQKLNTTYYQELVELHNDKMFSATDIYPMGFRKVRIGDQFALVNETYPASGIFDLDNKIWSSRQIKDSIFDRIVYYAMHCGDYKHIKVDHILYALKKSDDQKILVDKFGELFGIKSLKAHKDEDTGKTFYTTPVVSGVYGEIDDIGLVIWVKHGTSSCGPGFEATH